MLRLIKKYENASDISCVVVLVAFNTYDWIVSCVTSLRKHMPNIDVLVVNNNPSKKNKERLASFHGRTVYGTKIGLSDYCESENAWLEEHQNEFNLKIIESPYFMDHGRAIDFAVKNISGYDAFVHIEPDCEIYGTLWFKRLKDKIAQGYWMASGHFYPSKEPHPTPSIWRIDVFKYLGLSFVAFPRKVFTGQELLFYKIVDVHRMLKTHQYYWDTGFYAGYRCSRKYKASWVDASDFRHYYLGSANKKEWDVKQKYSVTIL